MTRAAEKLEMSTEDLFEQYSDRVYRLIRRTIRDRDAHADVFQEAFLNILDGLSRFEGRSQLSTWIYSVTLHTCFRHIRRSQRDRRLEFQSWIGEGDRATEDTITADGPPEQEQDPLEMEDLHRVLDDAVGRLAPRYRLPIHLFYEEGRSYREIAEILSIPLGTVKTNLYRGLQELRTMLGGRADELL